MRDERNRVGPIAWSLVLAIAVLAAYSSTYFAIVRPYPAFSLDPFMLRDPIPLVADYSRGHDPYRFRESRTGRLLELAFAPIHWLDRRLRPEKWADEIPFRR